LLKTIVQFAQILTQKLRKYIAHLDYRVSFYTVSHYFVWQSSCPNCRLFDRKIENKAEIDRTFSNTKKMECIIKTNNRRKIFERFEISRLEL